MTTPIQLDTVTTIAIGDTDKDGEMLSIALWSDFRSDVQKVCETYATVVATATGQATTSDQPDALPEDTYIVLMLDADLPVLRPLIAVLLQRYNASSACFSTDHAHEPIFATESGYRSAYEEQGPPEGGGYQLVPKSTPHPPADRPAHGGYPDTPPEDSKVYDPFQARYVDLDDKPYTV